MDITPHGFAGTLDEADWARMAPLLGTAYAVGSAADFLISAVPNERRISIAPGLAIGNGVVAEAVDAGTLDLPTPSAGQWYLIVLRRNWVAGTIVPVAIAGQVTDLSVPSTPPTVMPTFNQNIGVLDDQKIGWAWANSTTTSVVTVDIRVLRIDLRPKPDQSWSALTGKPATFAPSAHNHDISNITQNGQSFLTGYLPGVYLTRADASVALAGKSATGHGHDIADIRHPAYNNGGANGFWQGYLPDTYAPKYHTHDAGNVIVSGNQYLLDWIRNNYIDNTEMAAHLTSLQSSISAKSPNGHTHGASSIPTAGSNVQADIDFLNQGKMGRAETFTGAGVATAGNVVAQGDIGCNGRLQSRGSRNWQVSSNYVSAYLDANGYMGYAPSVRAMKQNIVPWSIDRDAFMAIKPVTFRYKSSVKKLGADAPVETGFIADDFLEAGLPQFTFNDPNTGEVSGLAYERLTTALWSIVQQQQVQIDELASRVAVLEPAA